MYRRALAVDSGSVALLAGLALAVKEDTGRAEEARQVRCWMRCVGERGRGPNDATQSAAPPAV